MGNLFSDSSMLTRVADASAAGTGEITTAAVDTSYYSSVVFFTTLSVADAGNFIKLQGGPTAATATQDITGTKVTATANGQTVLVELFARPADAQYLRAVVVRGAETAVGEVYCIKNGCAVPVLYNSHNPNGVKVLINGAYGTP